MLAGLFSGGLVTVVHQGRVIVGSIMLFGLSVAGFGVVLALVGAARPLAILWLPLLVIGSAASATAESWAAVGGGLLCVIGVLAVTAAQRGFWAYDARHPTP